MKFIIAIYLVLILFCGCDRFPVYRTNNYSSTIASFSEVTNSPCCKDSIIKDFAIPMNLDTTVHKWYYYYYGMKADHLVKEILFFKETNELLGVDLGLGRILYYYNPFTSEVCFEKSSVHKDSTRMKIVLAKVSKKMDSIIQLYNGKCAGAQTYWEYYDSLDLEKKKLLNK